MSPEPYPVRPMRPFRLGSILGPSGLVTRTIHRDVRSPPGCPRGVPGLDARPDGPASRQLLWPRDRGKETAPEDQRHRIQRVPGRSPGASSPLRRSLQNQKPSAMAPDGSSSRQFLAKLSTGLQKADSKSEPGQWTANHRRPSKYWIFLQLSCLWPWTQVRPMLFRRAWKSIMSLKASVMATL